MHDIVLALLVGDAAAAVCTCCCCCRPVNDSIRPIEPQGPFEVVDETTIGEFILRVKSQLFACSYGCLLSCGLLCHMPVTCRWGTTAQAYMGPNGMTSSVSVLEPAVVLRCTCVGSFDNWLSLLTWLLSCCCSAAALWLPVACGQWACPLRCSTATSSLHTFARKPHCSCQTARARRGGCRWAGWRVLESFITSEASGDQLCFHHCSQ